MHAGSRMHRSIETEKTGPHQEQSYPRTPLILQATTWHLPLQLLVCSTSSCSCLDAGYSIGYIGAKGVPSPGGLMASRPHEIDREDALDRDDGVEPLPFQLRRWQRLSEDRRRRWETILWRTPLGSVGRRQLEAWLHALEAREEWLTAQAEEMAALKQLLSERLEAREWPRRWRQRSVNNPDWWRTEWPRARRRMW
jgi:hypothetical protein